MYQELKILPAMQETQAQEDPLEKRMTTHSSILAWRILWTEEPGGLQFMGLQNQIRLKGLGTRAWLLYNIVLVSAVQRSESAICIHKCPPS